MKKISRNFPILNGPSKTVLVDIAQQGSDGAGVNATYYRAQHDEYLDLLDKLERVGFLRKELDRYWVTFQGLILLKDEKSYALIRNCENIFAVLQQHYKSKPKTKILVADLAGIAKLSFGQTAECLGYMCEFHFTGSHTTFFDDPATSFNEAPRSKLRGITELKHPELTKIFLRLPLPLHVPFDSLPVCPFPYRGHVVPIGPKLPAPQYPLHRGLSAKDLPRRDALEYLHNPAWSHFRMCTAEQMDMILVRPDRLHLDRKPFRDLCRRLLDNRRHHLIQQRFPVFHGKNNMVVDLPRTVRSLSDCLAPLVRHTPEGTRKDSPRSKLRGITS